MHPNLSPRPRRTAHTNMDETSSHPDLNLAIPRPNADRSVMERADRISARAASLATQFSDQIRNAKAQGLSELVLAEMPTRDLSPTQFEEKAALESAMHKLCSLCTLGWRAKPASGAASAVMNELVVTW